MYQRSESMFLFNPMVSIFQLEIDWSSKLYLLALCKQPQIVVTCSLSLSLSFQDSNSSLQTMEVLIQQTSGNKTCLLLLKLWRHLFSAGGVAVQQTEHRPEKHSTGDRVVWINMRMGCMFLLGASILFCLFAFCTGNGKEQQNLPTVSVSDLLLCIFLKCQLFSPWH